MAAFKLATPVAFIIFNRPDTTARVFAEIAKAKPPKLLVIADGPRADREGEAAQCAAARAIIERVDWPCEVLTNFAAENLGCKRRVSSGLDWVFAQVEEAIILEDDCVPHPDFFRYCETLLARYRDDERVMMICGSNFLENVPALPESYFFTNYYPIWGWAGWRRAWKLYDVEMKSWPAMKKSGQLRWLFSHEELARYYEAMFDLIGRGFDTWDIQWWYACVMAHGLAIMPRGNLIANVGMTGTHTATQRDLHTNLPTFPFADPVVHPGHVVADYALSVQTYERSHAGLTLDTSLQGALKRRRPKAILKALLPEGALRTFRALKKGRKP